MGTKLWPARFRGSRARARLVGEIYQMKGGPMIRFFAVLLAVILTAIPAQAQSRDVYTVRNIPVDERAASVIEAQQKAFASAKYAGAKEMIARITLPEDRAAAADRLAIDPMAADLLAVAVDVEEEVRGAGRYRGKLAVVYNPNNVRAFLDRAGVPYTDTLAPRALLAPIAQDAMQEVSWSASWPETSTGRIVPTVVSFVGGYSKMTDWQAFSGDLAANNATRVIFAELFGRPGSYRVELTSRTAAGLTEIGMTNAMPTLETAVLAAGDLLDDQWKRSAIVRDDGTRTRVRASVLYTSLAEWNTLRGALVRSPLVSNLRTEAVAREGAVVEFLYTGSDERFLNDMRQRGVSLQVEPIGVVMRSATSGAR